MEKGIAMANQNQITVRRTRVLFNWKPRVLDHTLGERLRRRLHRAGFATHRFCVEVRDPEVNKQQNAAAQGWHQDAIGSRLMLVMWANVRPTEVRFLDDSLLEVHDNDVLLVDNDEVWHRAPDDQAGRWFLRTLVAEVDSCCGG